MPELDLRWHELPADHTTAGIGKDRQVKMFRDSSLGLQEAAKEKRDSLGDRINKMMELRAEDPEAHRIIWHDLKCERHAIEKSIPGITSIYGSQNYEKREEAILGFSYGKFNELAAKPVIAGSGCNFQRFCSWAIYLGIGFKFNDFIQSVHRIQRFLQKNTVRIDLIYTESERNIRKTLETKWFNHKKLVAKMTELIRKYGLSHQEMANALTRKIGVERVVIKGNLFEIVCNDNVPEMNNPDYIKSDSVGLILTSIPFSTQYEYSPNYSDFGHSESNAEFFRQMDFLTPNLYRALKPGRIAAIHVKDRIVPMGLSGTGCQTVYPFHIDVYNHYAKHGFAYMGMKTIVTDVVRENNQTYRLGWTEQCKDGSKMGVGMPEYLLYFRKLSTDTSKAYADIPVTKTKQEYSRGRWQIDARAKWNSSGDRFLTPDELRQYPIDRINKYFSEFSKSNVYDFKLHVDTARMLEDLNKLPATFETLKIPARSQWVWHDVNRMITLNNSQTQKKLQNHICPLQFDIVDRVIERYSNPGELVDDPFNGIGTVCYRAIKLGRRGHGVELCADYWRDGLSYLRAAEMDFKAPTLFEVEKISEAV